MIDILLSTYNGEKYLSELLDSLLNQSYSEWKLWIRDDGSSDSTVRILDHYRRSYPNRINLIQSPREISVQQNRSKFCYGKLYRNT